MKLAEIAKVLGIEPRTCHGKLDTEVTGGYASDLLSDVMANSKKGNIWITLQVHQNIVAVASLNELAGIILVNNREPQEETVEKAEAEGIPILVTGLSTFETAGLLYSMGIFG